MAALSRWHHYYFLADPCSSIPVRTVLERRLTIHAPRSWRRDEQLIWAQLPPEIRATISRREHERETSIRRKHNQAAV
jgi:hypothetical protein